MAFDLVISTGAQRPSASTISREADIISVPPTIVHPRLFQLGNVAIPIAGVFTAIAILAGLTVARLTARSLSLDSEKVWDTGIAAVLTALIGPRLVLIFTNWHDFLAHPLWMLGLVTVRSPLAMALGLALAILATLALMHFARLPVRRALDAFAPALALGSTIYWVGTFLAGSHFGAPTTVPWAVTYTSRLASIWSQTPLGTPLHPVQIYFAILELCLFALTLALITISGRLRGGEILGSWLFLSGLASFFLSRFRGDLGSAAMLHMSILEGAMVLAGGVLWLL
jgi:phosphatidylglycerol:prolipoprotein diacylglycerol transferase